MKLNKTMIAETLRKRDALKYYEELDIADCWDELLEALGDDQEEIKKFISECDDYSLLLMSEIFEDIYGKFMNDDMGDFLDEKYEQAEAYRMSTIEKSAPIEE